METVAQHAMTEAEQYTYLVQNLRALQTPVESLWWPPAPGWWIVALLFVVLAGTLSYKLLRKLASKKSNQHLITIERQLDRCFDQWQSDQDTESYIHGVSALLKQSAIRYTGREVVARLHGPEWIEWMERETGTLFSRNTRALLGHSAYRKSPPLPDRQSHAQITQWNRRYTENSTLNPRANRQTIGQLNNRKPHNA